MRAFLIALSLVFSVVAHATPTVTARGSTGSTSGTTTYAITPASNLAAGSMGVLVVAADNAGTGGATTVHPTTVTDSVGNVWTRRQNPLYDPVGASAGVDVGFYTAQLAVALTTSNNVTITWAGGASVGSKAYAMWEIAPTSAAFVMSYISGAAGTGAASAAPTVTTSSLTSGDIVVAGGGAESGDTWGADADTTNGTWNTHQHSAGGTGATGMSVTSQVKIVTATATQQYDPTLTSADQIIGWIQLREIPAATGNFFMLLR